MKLRVPGAPALVSLFKALGTHPVSMQFGEVYTSLQTKVVDGQENPLSIIDAGKFYEVQKFCSMTNHVWDGHWIAFNRAAWNRLPDDVKTVVARAFNEGALAQRAELAELNKTLQADLEKKGMTLQHGRDAELPRAVAQGRLLQGMARQARQRSLVAAGEPGRQARLSAARSAGCRSPGRSAAKTRDRLRRKDPALRCASSRATPPRPANPLPPPPGSSRDRPP